MAVMVVLVVRIVGFGVFIINEVGGSIVVGIFSSVGPGGFVNAVVIVVVVVVGVVVEVDVVVDVVVVVVVAVDVVVVVPVPQLWNKRYGFLIFVSLFIHFQQ